MISVGVYCWHVDNCNLHLTFTKIQKVRLTLYRITNPKITEFRIANIANPERQKIFL